jgi:hypothetical protein
VLSSSFIPILIAILIISEISSQKNKGFFFPFPSG